MVTSVNTKSVAMMAGGTGGHVFPALALANELRHRGHQVTWIGTSRGLEARVVPENGIPLDFIGVQGLRRSSISRLLLAPLTLIRAVWQAISILRNRRPALVVGMGGFVSGPGGVAARLLGTPLVIHEQNAVPGLTNKLLSRLATRVLAAFADTFPADRLYEVTGNPIRPEISSLPMPEERFAGRVGSVRVLVMGGSLGAQALNEMLPNSLALMPEDLRPLVRHQAGRGKAEATEAAYRESSIKADVSEFIDDVAEALGWADLVICRAGALTVSELAAAGVGSVLVPYPYAVDDHQTANASVLKNVGAANVIQQSDLTAEGLSSWISEQTRDDLLTMARKARSCAMPDATHRVASLCEEVMS